MVPQGSVTGLHRVLVNPGFENLQIRVPGTSTLTLPRRLLHSLSSLP